MFRKTVIASVVLGGLLMPAAAFAAYGNYGYGTPYVYTVPFQTYSTSPYYDYCASWYTPCGQWNWNYGYGYNYGYTYPSQWYYPMGMSASVQTGYYPWQSGWTGYWGHY